MKKQSLIKGSLILGLAGMLAKVLGFFFRWPLIMLIGDEGIGYYQLSYPLYMFFVAMASGVPIAVSKMISEKNAIGDVKGSYEVVKESSFLMITLGLGTSLILFFFAKPTAPALDGEVRDLVHLGQDGTHLVHRHTGGQQGLVGIAQDDFRDLDGLFSHCCHLSLSSWKSSPRHPPAF